MSLTYIKSRIRMRFFLAKVRGEIENIGQYVDCYQRIYTKNNPNSKKLRWSERTFLGAVCEITSADRAVVSALLVVDRPRRSGRKISFRLFEKIATGISASMARRSFTVRPVQRNMRIVQAGGASLPASYRSPLQASDLSPQRKRGTTNNALTFTPQGKNARDARGNPYVLLAGLTTPQGTNACAMRETTPQKRPPMQPTDKSGQPHTEHFDFSITRAIIEARRGVKRPRSQKIAYGLGLSARQVAQDLGVNTIEKSHGSHYHYMHRVAFSQGGDQSKENLDIGTEGANYTTWVLLESLTEELLMRDKLEWVKVSGVVHFDETPDIPYKVDYVMNYSNGKTIRVSIDPRDHRKPTLSDCNAMRALFSLERKHELAAPCAGASSSSDYEVSRCSI